jgi:hypothetical protein
MEDESVGTQFLHSPDPSIRRLSAVVYSVATGIAVLAWAAWGGLVDLGGGLFLQAGASILESLLVWFVVAGIGLRAVRVRERRRHVSTQSVD